MNDRAIMLNPYASIEQFEGSQKIANALAHSRFVPISFRNSEPDCIMALGIASRLNADPLAVMNALYDVHGKIAFSSKFLIAIVNASGKFDPIRWEFVGKEGNDSWGARAYAKEKSSGEILTGPVVTVKMAKDEGWANDKKKRDGGIMKSKWKTMPELMLRYRAASFWISFYAPEYAQGMKTTEEVQDTVEAPQVEVVKQIKENNLNQLMDNVEAESNPEPMVDHAIDYVGALITLSENMYGSKWKEATVNLAKENGFPVQNFEQVTQDMAFKLVPVLEKLSYK